MHQNQFFYLFVLQPVRKIICISKDKFIKLYQIISMRLNDQFNPFSSNILTVMFFFSVCLLDKLLKIPFSIQFLLEAMQRARSAILRKAGTIQGQLQHQNQKNKMLQEDRRLFLRQAEEIKEKYTEQMEKLRTENKRLKGIRDQFIASKKSRCVLSRTGSIKSVFSTTDQNFLRITLDKEKHETRGKKSLLFTLQDKLKQVEENKLGFMEENPMVRTIRLLQNRLDRVMIKFNEAQAVQQTYEQVVRRLKEERVGYDSQLASIEVCLKGKQHDFEELLLLAHDATHAKEASLAEHKRFEQRRATVQEMRGKYISEKKEEINREGPSSESVPKGEKSTYTTKANTVFGGSYKHDENYQRQELNDYEQAFRKLKEVTGVIDANQIIQKFKTQGLTTSSLEDLQTTYSRRIEELKASREELKRKLQQQRFVPDRDLPERRRLDQIQQDFAKASNQFQRSNLKLQRLSKSMIDITAGIQHLKDLTTFYKIENELQGGSTEEQLKNLDSKIRKIYDIIKSDPNYLRYNYKVSVSAIQAMMKDEGDFRSYKQSTIEADEEQDQD